MENIETIQEEITTSVESVTVELPVRVKMTSVNNAPFEFNVSLDEAGQIVLTPLSKDVEFSDANTYSNVEYDVPVLEQETIVTEDEHMSTKTTTIFITANVLKESDNLDFAAAIDDVGQCVIYPVSENNTVISAAICDHLNLITESVDNTLKSLTNDYADACGAICCDTIEEQIDCLRILEDHYKLTCYKESDKYIVEYCKDVLTEEFDQETNDLIHRFETGDILILELDVDPSNDNELKHIPELDTSDTSYYYDEESDAIGYFKKA